MNKEELRKVRPDLYLMSNEILGPVKKRLEVFMTGGNANEGDFVGVGMSGVQMILIAEYGHLFERVVLFDDKDCILQQLSEIISLSRRSDNLGLFWKRYLGISLGNCPDKSQLQIIKNMASNGCLPARLALELFTSRLTFFSGKGIVDGDIRENHPLSNPESFELFRTTLLNKEVVLERINLLRFPLKIAGVAKLLYIDGLQRYSQERGFAFKYVAQKLLQGLSQVCDERTIVVEQVADSLELTANKFDYSYLKLNPECRSFRDTKMVIDYSMDI